MIDWLSSMIAPENDDTSVKQTTCIYRSNDSCYEYYNLRDRTDWTAPGDDRASNNRVVRGINWKG
jgi:hypothetical protein